MPNPQFGSGVLFGIPNAGNLATNPTPLQFPILQEVSLEIKGDLKKLYGQFQNPLAKARGKIDVSLKGKMASLSPTVFSNLYFGQDATTGVMRPIFAEAAVAAATVNPANSGTSGTPLAVTDLGVMNASTGQPMTKVTGTPAAGQYKFTPAVLSGSPAQAKYTFSTTDATANLAVLLNYQYNDSANGTTLSVKNKLMGYAPEFQCLIYNNFRGKLLGVLLYSCVMGALSIPTKQEDFWISDFDMEASSDASGNLLDIIADDL